MFKLTSVDVPLLRHFQQKGRPWCYIQQKSDTEIRDSMKVNSGSKLHLAEAEVEVEVEG